MKITILRSGLLFALIAVPTLSAFAVIKETTIESSVTVVNPDAPISEKRIVRIVGPDSVTYQIEAPASEVEQITKIVKEKPQAVLSFDGEMVDESGIKVFKIQRWQQVHTTTKTISSDALGQRTIQEKTETHTEPVK